VIDGLGAGVGSYVRRSLGAGHDDIRVAGSIGSTSPGQRVVNISVSTMSSPATELCQLYDDGRAAVLYYTYTYDNIDFENLGTGGAVPLLATGNSGTLALEIDASSASCAAMWDGVASVTESVPRPGGISADEVFVYAEHVELRLQYFVQIRTDD
jgi:hypothetical protein